MTPRKPEQAMDVYQVTSTHGKPFLWDWEILGRYFCVLYLPQVGCGGKQEEISLGKKNQKTKKQTNKKTPKNQSRFSRQPTGYKCQPCPHQLCPLGK